MHLRRTFSVSLAILGLHSATAATNPAGAPDVSYTGPFVTFYQDANYRGNFFTLKPGDSIENLGNFNFGQGSNANDRISSIRIQGQAEILVFENSRFSGNVMRLTESVRNLADRRLPPNVSGTWNDRISSIQINDIRRGSRAPDSDVLIKRAYIEVLGREVDPEGMTYARALVNGQGWTEAMLRDYLLKSDEYRTDGVNRLITRAYRDILKRDPDAEGLKNYRSFILDKGWSDQQVRNALRQSQEYKDRDKNDAGGPPNRSERK